MSILGTLAIVIAVLAAVIVALLIRGTRRAHADRALRASEERFRLVANDAPAMIWTARPDATLDYLNNTCSEFTGLPLERLRDKGWLDIVIPTPSASGATTSRPSASWKRASRKPRRKAGRLWT